MEKNKHNLKKAIRKIPSLLPDKEKLWNSIEHKMSEELYNEKNREKLIQAVQDIPQLIPDKFLLWQRVEERMSHSIKGRNRIRCMYYAASIILLFSASIIYIKQARRLEDKSITFSKEIIYTEMFEKVPESKTAPDVEELIARLCKEKPRQCQNPDFEQLNNELTKLKIEKQKITKDAILNNDPDADKYNEMIDRQINQLNNRILNFLMM